MKYDSDIHMDMGCGYMIYDVDICLLIWIYEMDICYGCFPNGLMVRSHCWAPEHISAGRQVLVAMSYVGLHLQIRFAGQCASTLATDSARVPRSMRLTMAAFWGESASLWALA